MGTPLVAITASVASATDARPRRIVVNETYVRAVEAAGGAPLILVPGSADAIVRRLLEDCRGLLLTGGGDVSPELYGEAVHAATAGVSEERDATESLALKFAIERDMPILAICRGMQVLNVVLGGTLWQDLPSQLPSGIRHRQDEARDAPTHEVRIGAGSRLGEVLGAEAVMANSMHHQGLKGLGEGILAVAWASDGLVEGVEMPSQRWVLGVQWHPEELIGGEEHARRLFAAFVEAAGR